MIAWTEIKNVAMEVWRAIQDSFGGPGAITIVDVFRVLGAVLGIAVGLLGVFIVGVVRLTGLLVRGAKPFLILFVNMLTGIFNILGGVVDILIGMVQWIWDLPGAMARWHRGIKKIGEGLYQFVVTPFVFIARLINTVILGAIGQFSSSVENIRQNIDRALASFYSVRNIINAMRGEREAAVPVIAEAGASRMVNTIMNVVLGSIAGELPRRQEGGITTGTHAAIIGERPEAIIPLDRLNAFITPITESLNELVSLVREGTTEEGGGVNINVNLDGTTVRRIIGSASDMGNLRRGRPLNFSPQGVG